jgi:hypothetical protein
MKNLIIVLFVFLGLSLKAQTVYSSFAGYGTVTNITGTGPSFDLTINSFIGNPRFEPNGQYFASDVTTGDVLWVNCTRFPITFVGVTSASNMVITVNAPGVDWALGVSGPSINQRVAIVSEESGLPFLPQTGDGNSGTISGISSDLYTCMLNHYQKALLTTYNPVNEIIDYIGIANVAPATDPTLYTGQLWKNSVGQIYRSNGVSWINDGYTLNTSTEFAGNGTLATPLKLAQQSAATGQTLKWDGTKWTPANDNVGSVVTANLTGTSKVTVTNGTGAVLGASNVVLDVNEANLNSGLIPIIDVGNFFPNDNVNAALQILGNAAQPGVTKLGPSTAPSGPNGGLISNDTLYLAPADDIYRGVIRLAGDLDVPANAPIVTGLYGRDLISTAPTNGQVYTWNSTLNKWVPTTPSAGGLTDLSIANRTANNLDVVSSTGTDATLPFATTTLAGLLTGGDKSKIDTVTNQSVSAGAGINVVKTGQNYQITNTGDLSNSNELQTISYSAPTITLSNSGGSFNIPQGTVTTVSTLPSNGITATVNTPGTTPQLVLGLGAITPTSVNASGTVAGSNLSGTNTGDNSPNSLYSGLVTNQPANLSVTGTTSPLSLNSSDGTDVTISGGTGIGLVGTSSSIQIVNTLPENTTILDGTTIDFTQTSGQITAELKQQSATSGQVLSWNGSNWSPSTPSSGVTDLSVSNRTTTTFDVLSNTGADATLPFATNLLAGLLVSTDKAKIDNITVTSPVNLNTLATNSHVPVTVSGETYITLAGQVLTANQITSTNITNGTILYADINQNGATTNQSFRWNGSAWVNYTTVTSLDVSQGLSNVGLDFNTGAATGTIILSANASRAGVLTAADWTKLNGLNNQTVSAGTGISVVQTLQNFAVTNTAPDQTVVITGATGTYPNFTLPDNSNTNELQTLGVSANTVTLSNSGGSFTIAGAGGITPSTSGTTITLTGTVPTGAETIVNQGTNITVTGSGTVGSPYVINNSAPESTTVTDGTTIDLTRTGSNITAELQQQAATTGQVLKWNGTSWVPQNDNVGSVTTNNLVGTARLNITNGTGAVLGASVVTADVIESGLDPVNIPITDTGNFFTTDNINSALQQLGTNNHVPLTVTDGTIIDFTLTGQNLTATILSGSITTTEIANGTIALADLSQMGATSGQTLSWNGSAWTVVTPAVGTLTGLTNGAGISITGSAPNLTVTNTGDLSIINELQTVANTSNATTHTATLSNSGGSIQLVEGSNITLTTTGTGLDGIVTIASPSTDLSITGTSSPLTVNSSTGTDFTVTAGTGVSLMGTSGNITINNTGVLTEVDGSLSNEGSLTLGAGTATTSLIQSNTSGSTAITVTAGTGLSTAEAGNVMTLTNTAPDQTVVITGTTGTYPNFTLPVISVTNGTGITASNVAGAVTITNSLPDQTVVITGSTGTYPNFTLPDASLSNEGSLTVGVGTATTSIINSNTSGSTGVTLTAGTGLSIAETGNVITLTNTSTGVTDLSVANRTTTTLDVLSNTGADATLPFATNLLAGLMVAADKAKSDFITVTANTDLDAIRTSSHAAVTLAGQNYLTIAGQVITANAVDLSGTHVTGTLKTASVPAFSGDVTNTAGSLATTITANAVTSGKILDGTILTGDIATGGVTSTNILDATVNTVDLANGSVTTAKLGQSGATNGQSFVWSTGSSSWEFYTPTTGTLTGLTGGTGISISGSAPTLTVTATDPSLSNEGLLTVGAGTGTTAQILSNTSGSNAINLSQGTGISITENVGSSTITITNNQPDQTVVLTGGGITNITGTYPNFTITSTEAQTASTVNATVAAPFVGSTVQAQLTELGASTHAAVTKTGENYISLTGQAITVNAVDVSGSNITGLLKAASFPALTGAITNTAGTLTTTLSNNIVGTANIIDNTIGPLDFASQSANNGQVLTYAGPGTGWVPSSANGDVAGFITNLQLGSGVVSNTEIASDAITTDKIQNGTILFQDFAVNGAVTGNVISYNGSAWVPSAPAATGLTGLTAGGGIGITGSSPVLTVINTGLLSATDGTTIDFTTTSQVLTGEVKTNSIDSTHIKIGGIELEGLSADGALANQFLKYNGANWVPSTISSNSISWPLLAPGSFTNPQYSFYNNQTGGLWFDGDPHIRLKAGGNGVDTIPSIFITGSESTVGDGGNINIAAGLGSVSGGAIQINAGEGNAGNGGSVTIRAGSTASGEGGTFILSSGTGINNSGGAFIISAGSSTNSNGGSFSLNAGATSTGTGGDFSMSGGASSVGNGGGFSLTGGSGSLGGGNFIINGGYAVTGPGGSFAMNGGESISGTGGSFNFAGGYSESSNGGNINAYGGESLEGNGGNVNFLGGYSEQGNGGSLTFTGGSTDGTGTTSGALTFSTSIGTTGLGGDMTFNLGTGLVKPIVFNTAGLQYKSLTTTQRNALAGVTAGRLLWNSTLNRFNQHDGTSWFEIPKSNDLTSGGNRLIFANSAGVQDETTIDPVNVLVTGSAFGGDVSGTYDNLQLGADVVGSAEIATDAVGSLEIANSAVGSSEIINGSVGALDLAAQSATVGQVLTYAGAGIGWTPATPSGGGGGTTTLDQAYNNFGTTASKITIDAAEGQTGGLEFETSGANNIIFDAQGTGEFFVQESGNTVLEINDSGYTSIGGTAASSAQKLLVTEGSSTISTPVRVTNTTARTAGGGVQLVLGYDNNDQAKIVYSDPAGAVLNNQLDINARVNGTDQAVLSILADYRGEFKPMLAQYYNILNSNTATENLNGSHSCVNVNSTSATTTINLPEIVDGASALTSTQIRVGMTLVIRVNKATAVTINRTGSDLIYIDGQTGTNTSVLTTGGFNFSKTFLAIGVDEWQIIQ